MKFLKLLGIRIIAYVIIGLPMIYLLYGSTSIKDDIYTDNWFSYN